MSFNLRNFTGIYGLQEDSIVFKEASAALSDPQFQGKAWYLDLDERGRTRSVFALITQKFICKHKEEAALKGKRHNKNYRSRKNVSGERVGGNYDSSTQNWSKGSGKSSDSTGKGSSVANENHLLADELGGDIRNHNIIWGTRTLNVGEIEANRHEGIRYVEITVKEYLVNHPAEKVAYLVIPIYSHDERMARCVFVKAQSVLNPYGVNINYFIPNVQEGFEICYQTGFIRPIRD
ncbi:DNA/RNA non-specific endonuclease [Lacticaseibacillus paracasei]|uniref:DNA/RNA non-specific endonuclease n=1 Tax=Lacticaseibacillus paracasei TaxID=1597 RepID=UPI00137907D6|nr:DNA/RNA non-specific endonuclease [Lacticaseibacillus paracasei]MCZ2766899.1 DNA/RNA non-specific endonuclease [Lacticaseibacillus paracasei]MCZ2769824.1 DNA/RNA non-specific endonuclease [Lacticaseibacillus paracasei]MCZ2775324.1 DNA/RNA non-specific endonuclease [Lacticaseibacillus paracasei]MCZ2778246.1 DNA/RNA non-specific endonuclease [Lacticaseibacillus paracasei]MCZ2784496.1 DNA/RNA non-specific endonuclease [Lacticaseibacillus paracasei]